MLYLLGERANFGRAKLRLFILEFAFSGTIAVFFFRHDFGGGTHFVLLVLQAARKRRRDRFFLAHLGGGSLMLLRCTLILEGRRLVQPLRHPREKGESMYFGVRCAR